MKKNKLLALNLIKQDQEKQKELNLINEAQEIKEEREEVDIEIAQLELEERKENY
jgi:hypothetical protein